MTDTPCAKVVFTILMSSWDSRAFTFALQKRPSLLMPYIVTLYFHVALGALAAGLGAALLSEAAVPVVIAALAYTGKRPPAVRHAGATRRPMPPLLF